MSELEYLHNRIRSFMNDTADYMAGGSCENFEMYQYMCGMIKAFATVEREILDMQEKIEKA